MQLQQPAPQTTPTINTYVASTTQVADQVNKPKRKIFIFIGILVFVLISISAFVFVFRVPDTNTNTRSTGDEQDLGNLSINPLLDKSAQGLGGVDSTSSGELVTSVSNQPLQINAVIYEILSDQISFLANEQLLTFPFDKMSLYTEVENLRKGQTVNLIITEDPNTGDVGAVQVRGN